MNTLRSLRQWKKRIRIDNKKTKEQNKIIWYVEIFLRHMVRLFIKLEEISISFFLVVFCIMWWSKKKINGQQIRKKISNIPTYNNSQKVNGKKFNYNLLDTKSRDKCQMNDSITDCITCISYTLNIRYLHCCCVCVSVCSFMTHLQ